MGLIDPSSPKNWLGAGCAKIIKSTATCQRTGKPNRLDQRVGHQCFTYFMAAALNNGKNTRMQIALFNGCVNGLGHDFASTGVGRMAFDHNRTARGQRRGGVAPGGGESEREV